MRIMLRMLSVLTVIIFLLGNLGVFALNDDVKGTDYEQAVSTLSALKIIKPFDDGTFRPDDTMTRAEITAIAVRLLGLENAALSSVGDTLFVDVPISHWAIGYINIGVNYGIVKGFGDGRFRPDDIITYEEAIKVIITTLGYAPIANTKGGYPAGYIYVAAYKGITENINETVGNNVKRGVIAQLLFNSLQVDMMENTQEDEYRVVHKTFLDCINVEKRKGQVTGNYYTTIAGQDNLTEDEVTIDTLKYKIGATNANEFLGYFVTYYYALDNKNGDETLIFIEKDKLQNNEISVNIEDILFNNSEFSNSKFVYQDDQDDIKDIEMDAEYVILNGKKTLMSKDLFKLPNSSQNIDPSESKASGGKVTLIDTDGNGKYETIFIHYYYNYVLSRVASDYTIYTKNTGPFVLDFKNKSIKIKMIDTQGKDVAYSDLKEWDVLSIECNEYNDISNGKLFYVVVSRDKISGEINEISDYKNTKKVKINDKDYEVALSCNANFEIGNSGDFYLDKDGKIEISNLPVVGQAQYAYLVDIAKESSLGGVQLKLFTSDGSMNIFKGADKIKVISSEGEKIYSNDNQTYTDLKPKVDQLVMYRKNGENRINEIVYPLLSQSTDKFSKDIDTSYVYHDGYLSGLYKIDPSETKVFCIPNDRNDDNSYQAKNMLLKYYKYPVKLYDITDMKVPKAAVVYIDQPTIDIPNDILRYQNFAIVQNISITMKDDETCSKVTLFNNGVQDIYTLKNNKQILGLNQYPQNLKKGSIVQFLKIGDTLGYTRVVYQPFSEAAEYTSTDYTSEPVIMKGSIEKIQGNELLIKNGTDIIPGGISDTKIYLVKRDGNDIKIKVGEASDLKQGYTIVVRKMRRGFVEIVQYEDN